VYSCSLRQFGLGNSCWGERGGADDNAPQIVGTARFFRSNGRAPIFFQKIQIRYRAHTVTLRCARPLQPRYHRRQGCAAPIDKNHQSPLTPMMVALLGWSCSLRNQGCGREDRERRKAEEGERKGMGAGCNFHTKPNEGNRTQTQGKMVETDLFKIDINNNKINILHLTG
jgi:hypothetical protein